MKKEKSNNPKNQRELINILSKYCDRIRYSGNHYICYPIGSNKTITVSSSSGDWNKASMVFRDFRRIGIYIKELES